MAIPGHVDLDAARAALRAVARGGDATLSAAAARLLVEELARLQQGNDRLRRQNKRVRRRLAAATGADLPLDEADEAGGGAADDRP